MLVKRNQFKTSADKKQKRVETDTETTNEQNEKQQNESEKYENEKEHENESEKYENEEERQVNLNLKISKEQSSNLSDILNLYYDGVGESERELSHLKRERKNMKITYVNQYLNKGSKLSSEENIKRQELKKKLLLNGEEITEIKRKLNRIRDDIVENLGRIKIE